MRDYLEINRRIIHAPPEYHATRHEQFRRDRERHQAKKERNANHTTHPCGCATVIEPHNHYRTVTIHFCRTHWKEERR